MSVRTVALRRRRTADRSREAGIPGSSRHEPARRAAPASHGLNHAGRTTGSLLVDRLGVVRTGSAPLLLAHTRNDNRVRQPPEGSFP